jgi:hypothetical protein
MPGHRVGILLAAAILGSAAAAIAQEALQPPADSVRRQSLDDAWWTGPMLANTAARLPPGHLLIEPYFYDVSTHARFDRKGARQPAPRSNEFGSLTYIVYGLTDRVSIGAIPTAGFTTVAGAPSSSGVAPGDVTLQAQYSISRFQVGRWMPTTAVAVQETLPTGKYDRLGDRPTDGLGGGARTTTVAFYAQMYFWLPNGRILRTRLNASQAFSTSVGLEDASVYGTSNGFRGRAEPGGVSFLVSSWEYSISRRWVAALDATYRHARSTRVTGYSVFDSGLPGPPMQIDSGASDAFGLAPAIEYSWTPKLGVLLGVRVIAAGRNASATITPAIAVNIVH